jgi:hypothetical protein
MLPSDGLWDKPVNRVVGDCVVFEPNLHHHAGRYHAPGKLTHRIQHRHSDRCRRFTVCRREGEAMVGQRCCV